jgi:hypothetical protein
MSAKIEVSSPEHCLELLATDLRIDPTKGLSVELVAAVMRRLASSICPCSSSSLIATTTRSLCFFTNDEAALKALAAEVVEDLVTSGDLVELAHVTLAGAEDKPTWLYHAPPSFVPRGKRVYLFGIAPDDAPFLPQALGTNILREGAARYIENESGDVVAALEALGVRKVPADRWLNDGKGQPATHHIEWLRKRLQDDGVAGPLPDMVILQRRSARQASYSGRWTRECDASGLHIARVERPHGAPLWYLTDLVDGRCTRSLLLPVRETAARACDQAWRAQLAIDATEGHPASYWTAPNEGGHLLILDFPLPLTARRRLSYLGGSSKRADNNPYVFWIPDSELANETTYLEQHLWMRKDTRV